MYGRFGCRTRINLFMNLPIAKIDGLVLKKKREETGRTGSVVKL